MSFQPDRLITIAVVTETSQSALLQGIDTWLRLDLVSDAQLNVTATKGSSNQSMRLEISTDAPPSSLLEGLNTWLQLGLLSNAQISVELTALATHPNLLEGLDTWVQLGLLPENRVKQLCQENLSCPLPQIPAHKPLPPARSSQEQREEKTPSLIGQIVQSLLAELSVMWLLLLGVFMVVVSSGVLAASQWQKFPAAGQYGVLLLYTLGFGGAGFLTRRQRNLRLTSEALRVVTLLLVPVNFLAMDSFGLWRNPLDLLIVAIASLTLTAVTIRLFRPRPGERPTKNRLPILNHLALSYLHWGWQFPGFPIVAVYLGTVVTTILTFYQEIHQPSFETPTSLTVSRHMPFSLKGAVVVYAVAILAYRAIFIARVDITQLGLALGICGILLAWLPRREQKVFEPQPTYWEQIGGSLLTLGWLVSVSTVPKQAIAVSGLGLVFFSRRLLRDWQPADLGALFVIGLQMHWLAWRLVPPKWQQGAIALGTQLTRSQDTPWALLSLVLFPYLILVVVLADQLHQKQQRHLATIGGRIALGFGTTLTVLSLVNPILRTLNLALSTVTLGLVSPRQWVSNKRPLVYLTHISGLLTLSSAIDYFLPTLSLEVWAAILLVLMVVEWVFSVNRLIGRTSAPTSYPNWRQSCWHLGLILSALSYCLLLVNELIQRAWSSPYSLLPAPCSLWLLTPLALTWVASQTEPQRRQSVSWLGVGALCMAQILTLPIPGTRLIGLGVGVGLMLVHTRSLQQLAAAAIAVGFSLSFVAALLWEGIPGLPRLSDLGWLMVGAIALTILWLLQSWFRATNLARIYAAAIDGWAITLCSIELFILTLYLGSYWGRLSASVISILAVALTMGAITYRSWQRPSNWGIYGFGWGLELLSVGVVSLTGRSHIALAIANIALGLVTQLLGDWWHRRSGNREVFSSWHVMPLLYGVLGATLRWHTFASWTGLSTLGLALIAIGVGRRSPEFKPLVYLAMVGVSASAYEILFYQISNLPIGDRLVAMAALATIIMYAYRVLSPWLTSYLHLTTFELKFFAHLHWSLGSCFLVAALSSPFVVNTLVGLGVGIVLSRYALIQGRHHPDLSVAEIWVYTGILSAVGIGVYGSQLLVPEVFQTLVPWAGAIATVVAYFLYTLPWESWGWPLRPWISSAFVLPLLAVGTTAAVIHPSSLLVAAGFYALLAQLNQQIRFTYISLLLVDWAVARWLWSVEFTELLAYASLVGLSLLYIAQIDPDLKRSPQKEARHLLRLLGIGIICVFALLLHHQTGILPGILSILAIFAGLALRVRAFLYVGTITFLVNAFYQLVILIFAYPLLKWIVGLLVGITFIWIAASFENRRHQITSLVRNWLTEFQHWQ